MPLLTRDEMNIHCDVMRLCASSLFEPFNVHAAVHECNQVRDSDNRLRVAVT
jgi:hypothetical protein